jgi:cation diffusion facilitator CzcD-associated flavoprotein CzcO
MEHDSGHGNAAGHSGTDAFPIAIIGAGFGGIGAAIRLQQEGFRSFTIFERAGEVGGTWRDNTYPGAACDVPSHAYSFSFEQNPEWTRKYSSSAEIEAYLVRCVGKHGLRPRIRFHTAIARADFDDAAGLWTLTTDKGEEVRARAVVQAVGGLVDPAWPAIRGLRDFGGELFHTARWNHDYDLTGKRVGVIGTGASAVQVVPAIAPRVNHLSVFQRTPAWVVPRRDFAIPGDWKQRFRRHPLAQKAFRTVLYLMSEVFGPMIILDSPRLSGIAERMSLRHLERSVKDPELRRKLTPDYQFGCKRMLVSDDYWPALERDNVELVTEGIDHVHAGGVRTRDGRDHPLDVLIAATGFELGLATAPFESRGLGGRTLADRWKDGAVAYKGLAVSGFPNWFILMGPNTGPGHTSVIIYTEAQIEHLLGAVRRLHRGARYLTVRGDVQDRYNRRIQARMKHTVWASGCKSWYLSPDGSNHSLFPGLAAEYVLRTRRFRESDYEVVGS